MDGLTAVVTGASRGIGASVAEAFAAGGAHVVACARDADELAAALDDADAGGGDEDAEGGGDEDADEEGDGDVTTVRADVRDEFDVERLMETAARVGGEGIDVVVANAGVFHGSPGETPLSGESYAAFDDTFRTNVRGVFASVREALPHLNADARVLVPTGTVARAGKAGYGAYAPSKAAVEAVVRGLAAELDQTVGCVDPGQIATDLTGGRGRDPESVAGLYVWAATKAPAEELDGEILGLKAWKRAARS